MVHCNILGISRHVAHKTLPKIHLPHPALQTQPPFDRKAIKRQSGLGNHGLEGLQQESPKKTCWHFLSAWGFT